MKTFKIEATGRTLSDIEDAIREALSRIENGNLSGFDENDDGNFSFDSTGEYEEKARFLVTIEDCEGKTYATMEHEGTYEEAEEVGHAYVERHGLDDLDMEVSVSEMDD